MMLPQQIKRIKMSHLARVHFSLVVTGAQKGFSDFLLMPRLCEHFLALVVLHYGHRHLVQDVGNIPAWKTGKMNTALFSDFFCSVLPYDSLPHPETMAVRPSKTSERSGMQMGTTCGFRSIGDSSSKMAMSFSKVGA